MLSQFSYPIVCSDCFKKSVAFYEDHFDFVSAFEMDGFVILKREGWENVYLAIIDSEHDALPEHYKRPTQGLILNYPVENVIAFYDDAYHEGLNLISEPKDTLCGRKHFFIEDPSGLLIDVAENIDLSALVSIEPCGNNQAVQSIAS